MTPAAPPVAPRRVSVFILPAAVAMLLAACASTPLPPPPPGTTSSPPVAPGGYATDGPLPNPPADLARTPDPEPRVEPVRASGPNKPYQALGEVYVPITDDQPVVQKGLASWYGRKFHGKPTASGELYNMYAMTAAHPTLPIPSYARVRNPANGREVIVRVNDRGPFSKSRIVDLSYTAALKLDILRGVAPVELERITHEAIRTGSWRRSAATADTNGPEVASLNAGPAGAPGNATPPDATAEPQPGSPVRLRELWGQELNLGTPTPTLVASNPMPLPTPQAAPARPEPVSASSPVKPATATRRVASDSVPDSAPFQADPAPAAGVQIDPARTAAGKGWWVQLGAFRERAGAQNFQQQTAQAAAWIAPLLALFDEKGLHKLQVGPFPAKGEALSAMHRLKEALSISPVLVERR